MAQRASIDISNNPELRRLAEDVRDTQKPVILRTESDEIAVLTPITREKRSLRKPTQEEIDTVMSAAGSWKGLVDVDELKAEWKAARGSDRPSVDL